MNTLPTLEELKESNGAIFYDFDGVLTDNRVLVTEQGVESEPGVWYCEKFVKFL